MASLPLPAYSSADDQYKKPLRRDENYEVTKDDEIKKRILWKGPQSSDSHATLSKSSRDQRKVHQQTSEAKLSPERLIRRARKGRS